MGRGTYVGGSKGGGAFFTGFMADFTLQVFEQEVLRLSNGDLRNTLSGMDKQGEYFDIAEPVEFTRAGPGSAGAIDQRSPQSHRERYTNVPLANLFQEYKTTTKDDTDKTFGDGAQLSDLMCS